MKSSKTVAKIDLSVYGRSCRPESTFGISTCRQCCSASECYSDSTILAESFNTEAEWMDETHHATWIESMTTEAPTTTEPPTENL